MSFQSRIRYMIHGWRSCERKKVQSKILGCKKLRTQSELDWSMSRLKVDFPHSKCMWQIVKDVLERKVNVNLFTDQWPYFTTVISQEFSPRLSEVADIRIYTTNKEKIMPLLEEAELLENIGSWQLIHYYVKNEDSEALSSYLLDSLRHHPNTKEKTSSVIFDYATYQSAGKHSTLLPIIPLPPGFYLKVIPQDTADYIAKNWSPAAIEYPLEYRTRFIRDLMTHFWFLGVYKMDEHKYPVAWVGRKTGGVLGITFTSIEYRERGFAAAMFNESCKRHAAIGDLMTCESKDIMPKFKSWMVAMEGRSQIIAIY